MNIDFFQMAVDSVAKTRAKGRKSQHTKDLNDWKIIYDELRDNFNKLADNSSKAISSISLSKTFHVMQKFKERADKLQGRAVTMYLLSHDSVRPEKGQSFSMGTLKKVEDAVKKAVYGSFTALSAKDIGKPLDSGAPDEVIDSRSFSGKEDDLFYNLTRDEFYTVDDYRVAIDRANKAIDQFEQEGRSEGLIVD